MALCCGKFMTRCYSGKMLPKTIQKIASKTGLPSRQRVRDRKEKKKTNFPSFFFPVKGFESRAHHWGTTGLSVVSSSTSELEEVCHGFNAKSKRRREKKENVWDAFRSPSGIGSIREKNRKRGGENAKDTAPPIPHQSIVLGWHCGLLNR